MKRLIILASLIFAAASSFAAEVTTVTAPTASVVTSNSAKRDPAEAAKFRATHACPATGKIQKWCKGYVVDHIVPLCAGGADDPSNMQWQDKQASYAKDKLERAECEKLGTISPHTSHSSVAAKTSKLSTTPGVTLPADFVVGKPTDSYNSNIK